MITRARSIITDHAPYITREGWLMIGFIVIVLLLLGITMFLDYQMIEDEREEEDELDKMGDDQ